MEETEILESFDDILKMDDRPVEDFHVKTWGKTVKLRAMMGNDRDAWEAHVTNGGKEGSVNLIGMRAKLVASCLVNSKGDRIVKDSEVSKLGTKNAAALEELFIECQRMNGISEEDVKELEENFDNGQSE